MAHEQALTELRALLGERLATGDSHRNQHGENESYYPLALPDAVAFPETTEEVAKIVRICNAHDCPITPYAIGSSLEGQHLPIKGGISLDMMRMTKVLAVNAEDLNCVVQPGITREELNTELRATGLFFPIDPGANASIGGMTATRASGTMAVRYGTMRENVLALEAVMADGTVIRTGSKARKSSTGYDLTHLLVGSEGTLGIITGITLKLQGQPEAISAATCRFESVEDAVNCVILTIQSGIPMARIELVNDMMVRGFNLHMDAGLPEQPHLFLEFQGAPSAVREQAEAFGEIAGEFGATGFARAESTEERNRLWAIRHNGHYANNALNPGKKTMATDICVPISKLAEAVVWAERRTQELGITCTIVGHVGDGNFHCGLRVDPDDPEELARCKGFVNELNDLALSLDGTVSGEHGIGIGKQAYMAREHGAALTYMRAIKSAFDPKNILNPGKLLPPGNM